MKESAFTDRAGALDANERVRLMRDGLVNNSGAVVSVVVGIVLVPIMLHGLGTESYSLWIAALAVLGMPAGLDFGLGATVIREVAARGRERHRREHARDRASAQGAKQAEGLSAHPDKDPFLREDRLKLREQAE